MKYVSLLTILVLCSVHSITFTISEATLRKLSERRLKVELNKAKKNNSPQVNLINQIGAERFGWQFGTGTGTDAGKGGGIPDKPTAPPAGAGDGEWKWIEKQGKGEWKWVATGDTIGGIPGAPATAPPGAQPTLPAPPDPSVPLAPPAPPISPPKPSAAPDIDPVTGKPRKEKALVDYINTPLSASELGKLTPQQKRTSDTAVLEAIKEIADNFPVLDSGEVSEIDFANKKQKFTNGIDAYVTQITRIAVEKLGKSSQFKKYAELLAALSEKDKQGSIEKALDQYRKPLAQLKALFSKPGSEPVSALLNAIQSLTFDTSEFAKQALKFVRTIGINAGVSSRSVDASVSTPAQVLSDSVVLSSIQDIFKAAQVEVDTLKKSDEAVALLAKAVENVTDEKERDRLEKDALATYIAGKLSRDYIDELSNVLNVLRLNEQFKKFIHLVGTPAKNKIPPQVTGIARLSWEPLINMIAAEDEPLNPALFLTAVKKQTLYNGDDLDRVVKRTDLVYKAVQDDHQVKVIKRMGSVDIAELLADRFETIKNVKGIRNLIAFVKKAAGTRPGMQTILSELEQLSPNMDTVIEAFKKLAESSTLPYEKKLRDIITQYIQENQVKIGAQKVLEAAVQQFAKTKAPIGKWLSDELSKQKVFEKIQSAAQRQRLESDLTTVDRTPKTIRKIFIQLFGASDPVKTLVKDTMWYEWIEPYGLLMMVLKTWPQEVLGQKGLDAKLDKLKYTLQAMNNARLVGTSTRYVSSAVQEKAMLEAGLYKNKLLSILTALDNSDYPLFIDAITALVKEANVGTENSEEFKRRIESLKQTLTKLISEGLLEQLQELNRGGDSTYEIKGLDLEGPQKNVIAQVYFGLKGVFESLITAVKAFVANPTASDVTSIQTAIQQIKKTIEGRLTDTQKAIASAALNDYLERVIREMKGLKQIAVAKPSVPTKPPVSIPAPGAIPAAPAPGMAPAPGAGGSVSVPIAPPLPSKK